MPGVYDYPCPVCGGRIVSTARMMDCTKAPTSCENKHSFMRAEATATSNLFMTKTQRANAFHTNLKADLGQNVSASDRQDKANEQAKKIRMLELQRKVGYSKGRMLLTLGHKYGFTREEAEAAIQYITRLGLTGNPKVEALNEMVNMGQPQASTKKETTMASPLKLEASTRLKQVAMTKLMARATQVSRVAEKGMREIVQEMIKLGYKADTVQNKAFYTTKFFNEESEDKPEHTFTMIGWHGTGRYGAEKTVLEFYDDDKNEHKPVVSIGVLSEENINPARQLEVITQILNYVKHHG